MRGAAAGQASENRTSTPAAELSPYRTWRKARVCPLSSLSSPLGLEGKDGLGPEYFLHVYHTLAWRAAKPSSWSGRASGLGPAGGFLFPATGQ